MTSIVRAALRETLALAFPVWCCACAAAGADLCGPCAETLVARPRPHPIPGGPTVWSAIEYGGTVAAAVRALKQEGRTGLARPLAPLLARSVAEATGDDDDVLLVPVPTSRAAMRRRGYRVVELLIRRAGLAPFPALGLVRRVADQRGLGRDERGRNTRGAMRARGVGDRHVLIVDDVVTTGATIREAERALVRGGARVVGAATLAATSLRMRGFHTGTRGFQTDA